MGGQYAAAMFFVPLGPDRVADPALTTIGPLGVDDRRLEVLDFHAVVSLFVLRSSFFDLIRHEHDIPVERDPALPVALALRDEAARAGADVAMLTTEPHMMTGVRDWYWMVILREVPCLLREGFHLLYLGDAVTHDWTPPDYLLAERDELPGGPGRTFFAQRGQDRWY